MADDMTEGTAEGMGVGSTDHNGEVNREGLTEERPEGVESGKPKGLGAAMK